MDDVDDTYDAALSRHTANACKPARDERDLQAYALDLQFMARNGQALAIDLAADEFPRFRQNTESIKVELSVAQSTDAAGYEQRYLGLYVAGKASLSCGRCLQELPLPLEIENEFLLVDTEEQAASLDEQQDDIEVIAVKRYLRLTRLVEDELLMAMPLSANHEACDLASPSPLGQNRPNPFAVLAKLKKPD